MNLNGPRKTRNENRYKFILSPKMFNVNVVELISMLKSALISMNDCDQNFRHHFVAINFSVKLIQCGKTDQSIATVSAGMSYGALMSDRKSQLQRISKPQ